MRTQGLLAPLESVFVLRDTRIAGRHSDGAHFLPGESSVLCVVEARINRLIVGVNKTQVLVTTCFGVVSCQLDQCDRV